MMERKLDKEATILYSNETESEVRRMKDKKIARKSQIMYFRAKDVVVSLSYKKDTKTRSNPQKQKEVFE